MNTGASAVIIELKLTPQQVNIILTGLGELPAKISSDLLVHIREQGNRQIATANSLPVKKKAVKPE